ncbi:MAG: tetratricopeptide repeat protein [Rhodospirillaceae bacterium]
MAGRTQRAATTDDGTLTQMLVEAVGRHQAGDLAGAERAYRKVLARAPQQPHALHLLGVVLHQKGENAEAARLIGKAIKALPDYGDFHSNLGAIHYAEKQYAKAAESFRRAVALNPGNADLHSNLAAVLNDLGDADGAIEAYRVAHQVNPGAPKYLKRLADLYLERDQYGDAARYFRLFLEIEPDNGEVHNNLGYAYERLGRLEEAEKSYRRAVELNGDVPEINNNIATVLRLLGRTEEAEAYFQRAIAIDPARWEDLAHLAGMYLNRREPDKALPIYETLLPLHPDNAKLYNDYGICLSSIGRISDGTAAFQRAIELDPEFAEAFNNLGTNKMSEGDRLAAIAAFKSAIGHKPRYIDAHTNLCLALQFVDRYDEAYIYARATMLLEDFRPIYAANPSKVFRAVCDFDGLEELGDPWVNMEATRGGDISALFLEMLVEADTAEKVAMLSGFHKDWGGDISERARKNPLPPFAARRHDKIRLGFVSSDLRGHSVAKFTLPLFERLDRDRFEISCFAPNEYPEDAIQNRFKSIVDRFTVVRERSMREMAEDIRSDGVDILFELNGFTRDSRLKVMAHRAAPVQVSWLGYPFTTGIGEFDYMLLDPLCRPAEDSWLVEKPLLMPQSWVCFGEFPAEPISDTLPMERNGIVSFGTLNNPYKYTRKTIALWAEVMNSVPDSRFLVVRPECASALLCSHIVKEFGRHGIGPERLNVVNNRLYPLSHFNYYDEIDVTLDTFPVTGGTTTCEALWMGAPVVSMTGPSVHHRLSQSLLTNAGFAEMCTTSPEDYVRTGIALAQDRDRLAEIRQTSRQRLLASPLCDADGFTRAFEGLMTDVARRHGLV